MIKIFEDEDDPEYYVEGNPIKVDYSSEHSVSALWSSLTKALAPVVEPSLFAPPVSPEAYNAFAREVEAVTGKSLPDELGELYRQANGHASLFEGVFMGMSLLSIEDSAAIWKELQSHDGAEFDSECESIPANAIRLKHRNPGWIPLASDFSGNYIGIDLDPDAKGEAGQMINFGRDEEVKMVLAPTLRHLLIFVLQQLEAGRYRMEGDDESGEIYLQFPDNVHPLEGFKACLSTNG
ncbi:SMI1/KNR4 family protein [Paenibacillus sp. CAU 1782]